MKLLEPIGVLCLLSIVACGGAPAPEPAPPPPPPPPPEPAAAPAEEPPAKPEADPVGRLQDVGFKTPESVLYVPDEDVYLVSNINGKPVDADDNGFISKVKPAAFEAQGDAAKSQVELRFIDGASDEVTLGAPKGMAVADKTLAVADLTVVRLFELDTGKPAGEIPIKGSTFLNDVTTGPGGTVYVSDSGLKLGKEGFEPTGSDAVYELDLKKKKAKPLIKNKDLNGPNGIAVSDAGVWVNTFRANEIFLVTPKGKKDKLLKAPKGGLDGLILLDGGNFLVSSWEAETVYRGTLDGEFEPVISGVKSPADIGYDIKRSRVLVPLFQLDAVESHPLK